MGDLAVLEALAEGVVDSGVPLSAATLHGAACGFAVFQGEYFPYYELADLLDPGLSGDEPALVEFVDAVREALASEDLDFALLLPDDDAPIVERLAALGLWCGSFLSAFGRGLGMAPEDGLTDEGGFALPDEIQEVIDDLAAIAEVEPESALHADEDEGDDASETDAEDAEAQVTELEEFVKVAVLLIMSVLARGSADSDY